MKLRQQNKKRCSAPDCDNFAYKKCDFKYQNFLLLSYITRQGGCEKSFCKQHLNQEYCFNTCSLGYKEDDDMPLKKEKPQTECEVKYLTALTLNNSLRNCIITTIFFVTLYLIFYIYFQIIEITGPI